MWRKLDKREFESISRECNGGIMFANIAIKDEVFSDSSPYSNVVEFWFGPDDETEEYWTNKPYRTCNSLSGMACNTCELHKKWGVLLSFESPTVENWEADREELFKAAPILKDNAHSINDGFLLVMFDTEEEMLAVYKTIVGDDGPTELNPYNGECRVYALTISPDGETMNENT